MSLCQACEQWDIRPDDRYCANCGAATSSLNVVNSALLLPEDAENKSFTLQLVNTGHSLLFVVFNFTDAVEQGFLATPHYPDELPFLVLRTMEDKEITIDIRRSDSTNKELYASQVHYTIAATIGRFPLHDIYDLTYNDIWSNRLIEQQGTLAKYQPTNEDTILLERRLLDPATNQEIAPDDTLYLILNHSTDYLTVHLINRSNGYLHLRLDTPPEWLIIEANWIENTEKNRLVIPPFMSQSQDVDHIKLQLRINSDDYLETNYSGTSLNYKYLEKLSSIPEESDFASHNEHWFSASIELPSLDLTKISFVDVRHLIGEDLAKPMHSFGTTESDAYTAIILGEKCVGSSYDFTILIQASSITTHLELNEILFGIPNYQNVFTVLKGTSPISYPSIITGSNSTELVFHLNTESLHAGTFLIPVLLNFGSHGSFTFHIQLNLALYPDLDGYMAIDFGTRNSCLAVCYSNQSEAILPTKKDDQLVPSVAYFYTEKLITFGLDALKLLALSHRGGIKNIKRFLGKTEFNHFGNKIAINLIIQQIIKWLVFFGQNKFQVRAKRLALTVPVHFSSEQRNLLREAVFNINREAINDVRIYEEPVAVAMYYYYMAIDGYINLESHKKKDVHMLVYDFGGGTLDIVIFKLGTHPGAKPELLAQQGHPRMGGMDLDYLVGKWILEQLQLIPCLTALCTDFFLFTEIQLERQYKGLLDNNSSIKEANQKFLETIEAARIALSNQKRYTIRLDPQWLYNDQGKLLQIKSSQLEKSQNPALIEDNFTGGKWLQLEITSNDLEAILSNKITESLNLVDTALQQSSLSTYDIDYLIMSGQVSRTTYIKKRVAQHFSDNLNIEIVCDTTQMQSNKLFDPKHCVALGAARMGKSKYGSSLDCQLNCNSRVIGIENGTFIELFKPGEIWDIHSEIQIELDNNGEEEIRILERHFNHKKEKLGDAPIAYIPFKDESNANNRITVPIKMTGYNEFIVKHPTENKEFTSEVYDDE